MLMGTTIAIRELKMVVTPQCEHMGLIVPSIPLRLGEKNILAWLLHVASANDPEGPNTYASD